MSPNSGDRNFEKNYRWDKLHESIKKDGYDTINNEPISAVKFFNKYYIISDGHHRVVIWQDLYGEDYEIDIKIINFLIFYIFILLLPVFIGCRFIYIFIYILFKDYLSNLFIIKKQWK